MRGRLVVTAGRRRRGLLAWFVVSRLGPGGRMLAIGLAARAGAGGAPAVLRPRLTLLAVQEAAAKPRAGLTFRLLPVAQPQLRLAGRWRAAAGQVRLAGRGPRLTLVAAGRLAAGPCWRLSATQQPWLGAWPPADHAALTLVSRRMPQVPGR